MTNEELIAKIKAEIERLKGQLIRGACAAQIEMRTMCKEEAYDEVLSFLSTLESEKPKPISTEDMPYITDEHFYEREPADSFKYKLAEYMTKCCTKKEGPYGYTYGISAESILKMAEEELLKRGVVQKPGECSKED